VSQSTQVFLVRAWTCGYCRQLLTKFAIPMVKVQLLEQDLLTSMLPAAVDHYQDSVNYILLCHTTLHRVSTADNMVLGIPRKASESGSAALCCKQDKGGISFRWVHRFKYSETWLRQPTACGPVLTDHYREVAALQR